jgi:hypothetical protein
MASGLAEFRQADADFNGLAGEIVAMEWTQLPTRGGDEGPSVPTLGAAEMLSDLSLAGESSAAVARRVRLTMPVAAAVRAALDWLAGRDGVRAPIELRQDASALEILCEMRDPAGVPPAHQVLSNVDGNLGPPLVPMGAGREGSWLIRVPCFSARPAYVMIMQGTLRLAVPWHAVLRIQVTPRAAIHARAARAGMTVLPRLSSLATRGGECPVVIVGHGLKRAWMVADRLVWRLPAELCDPDSRLAEAGLLRAVETDDGEVFGLVEPRLLLASAPLPALPRASHAALAEPAAPRVPEILDEASVTPLPAIVAETAPAVAAAEATEYVAQAAPDVDAAARCRCRARCRCCARGRGRARGTRARPAVAGGATRAGRRRLDHRPHLPRPLARTAGLRRGRGGARQRAARGARRRTVEPGAAGLSTCPMRAARRCCARCARVCPRRRRLSRSRATSTTSPRRARPACGAPCSSRSSPARSGACSRGSGSCSGPPADALRQDRVRRGQRPPRILVVDDDRRVVELLDLALSAHGSRC